MIVKIANIMLVIIVCVMFASVLHAEVKGACCDDPKLKNIHKRIVIDNYERTSPMFEDILRGIQYDDGYPLSNELCEGLNENE